MNYLIRWASVAPDLKPDWQDPIWARAETLELKEIRPESCYRPRVLARLMYQREGIHGLFQVHDQYVRCVRTEYHDEVWKDSCVEFFAQPKPDRGYLNFEFNCGGAFLCSHITDPTRVPGGFKGITKVPASLGQSIQVCSSLPRRIEPEITEPLTWTLRFFIPFALVEHYMGPLGEIPGQVWRGNFFKCADESSHPHWSSWAPVDEFEFHRPNCFESLTFENVKLNT